LLYWYDKKAINIENTIALKFTVKDFHKYAEYIAFFVLYSKKWQFWNCATSDSINI